MRQEMPVLPAAWLTSAPIPINSPASILSAFKPGTAKVFRFAGPHSFYRAAGWDTKRGSMASAYGSWWADTQVLAAIGAKISMFENWLPKDLLNRAWPAQYRGASALCEDWNDMKEMFRLDLPTGQELVGLVGLAAPQPQKSTLNPKSGKTPTLQGGGEQVFFKKTSTLNSINPLWVYQERLW
jgi:hypothetical protein